MTARLDYSLRAGRRVLARLAHCFPQTDAAGGGAAVVAILEGVAPRPGGWFELVIEGMDALASRALLVVTSGMGECDYELAVSGGAVYALFHAAGPVEAVRLASGDGVSPLAFSRLTLSELPTPALLFEAFRRAPRQALAAGFWALAGKKVRARNRLRRIVGMLPGGDYTAWREAREPVWAAEAAALEARLRREDSLPLLTVLIAGNVESAETTAASIAAQHYPGLRVTRLADATVQLEAGPGAGWLLPLRSGDRLASGALWRIAAAIRDNPGAAVVYGDHDLIDATGVRRQPQFKPEWNPPYFVAWNYIGRAALDLGALARQDAPSPAPLEAWTAEAILRLAGSGRGIVRVPRILMHLASRAAAAGTAEAHAQAVERAAPALLELRGVALAPTREGYVSVRWSPPRDAPLVSAIVPTRDRLDLLEPCIAGLLERTNYRPLEIVVADNESRAPATHAYLRKIARDPRVGVVRFAGPFNFSAINNAAVRASTGKVLCFLNNDVEVLHPDWLEEMVAHAVRPEIGAVGALLLYPSGLVQHAGIIVGLEGLAGHAHRFFSADHPGYMERLRVPQYVSAVTAACLVIDRSKFEKVGGFDEAAFPVALNDVDLCLRLRAAGFENLWTPQARLIHKESASRASDVSSARRAVYNRECEHFRKRWPAAIAADPYYNPNLTRMREDFGLAES
jgi:GT2 family glycosyltransferase